MEIKIENIKKENLAEAKKQFETEKKTAEIEYAKQELRRAQDRIDECDRGIKNYEEAKKPFLEILARFK